MCCLKNEQLGYEELIKITPRVGSYVKAGTVQGHVTDVNLLTGKLKIKSDGENATFSVVDRGEVTILKEGKPQVNNNEKP